MSEEICAGGIIYTTYKNKLVFLLLKSKVTNYWVFPKGGQLDGESLIDTAKREIYEETGIIGLEKHQSYFEVINFIDSQGKSKKVYHYLFKSNTPDVSLSKEHLEYKWLPFDEAYNQINFENQKRLLAIAIRTLKNKRI